MKAPRYWIFMATVGIAGGAWGQVAPPMAGNMTDVPASLSPEKPGGTGLMMAAPEKPVLEAPRSGGITVPRASQAQTVNALVGAVNHVPVFVDDVLRPIDERLRQLATKATMSEFRQGSKALIGNQLWTLIRDMMIVSSAEAMMTEQDKQRLEFQMNKKRHDLLADYGGSVAAADKALAASGTSLEKMMQDNRRAFLKSMWVYKYIMPNVNVTRQMVIDAYERDPDKSKPATVELYTVTVYVSRWLREPTTDGTIGPIVKHATEDQIKNAEMQALALGKEIAGKARAPDADWAQLAEDYHSADGAARTGGRYTDPIKKGSLGSAKMEELAFSLPAYTVGEPLLIHDADFAKSLVVVVKVGKKMEAHTIPFIEARDGIASALREQQANELSNQALLKLTTQSSIEGVDQPSNLNVVLEAAVARYMN